MIRKAIRLYFTFNVVLLVMLGLSLPFQQPGTETYVVSVISLVIVLVSLLASGLVVYFDLDGAGSR